MSTLFTIEQIELIQRLRRSGIHKEAISSAFDELSRLDNDPLFSWNPNDQIIRYANEKNLSSNGFDPNARMRAITSTYHYGQKDSVDRTNGFLPNLPPPTSASTSTSAAGTSSMYDQINGMSMNNLGNHHFYNHNSHHHHHNHLLHPLDANFLASNHDPSLIGNSLAPGNNIHLMGHHPNNASNVFIYERTPELDEFLQLDETERMLIIKRFIFQYNIRQNMIAEMTRISQAYISRFFRGEGHDMSERAKNIIYMWYLQCKKEPSKILASCTHTIKDKNILSENGDLLPIKRDRFIFRKQHLAILEKYFRANQYPDMYTKEEIAEKCNTLAEKLSGSPILDRDRVTVSIVSNWFNNKRKDEKNGILRKHSIENTPLTAAPSTATTTTTTTTTTIAASSLPVIPRNYKSNPMFSKKRGSRMNEVDENQMINIEDMGIENQFNVYPNINPSSSNENNRYDNINITNNEFIS